MVDANLAEQPALSLPDIAIHWRTWPPLHRPGACASTSLDITLATIRPRLDMLAAPPRPRETPAEPVPTADHQLPQVTSRDQTGTYSSGNCSRDPSATNSRC
ncbi:hypothetical protein ACFQ2M_41495, partial [Kitasatospora saccharophila]|uniref:hypothetical protein n=1 Tax=Kitasatospora saccharophila TaxID=407973 RepID=UPI00362D8810